MSDFFATEEDTNQARIDSALEPNPHPTQAQGRRQSDFIIGGLPSIEWTGHSLNIGTGPSQDLNISEVGRSIGRSIVQTRASFMDFAARTGDLPDYFMPSYLRGDAAGQDNWRRAHDPQYRDGTLEHWFAEGRDRDRLRVQTLFPRAQAQSAATQIVSGIAEVMSPAVVAGPFGLPASAVAVGASTEERSFTDLRAEGVPENIARGAAYQDAALMSLMTLAPASIEGNLARRALFGAGVNMSFGAAMRYSSNSYLTQEGYPELARRYQWMDPQAAAIDGIIGFGFGAVLGHNAPPSVEPHLIAGEPPPAGGVLAGEAPVQPLPQDANGYFDEARQYGNDQQFAEAYAYALIAKDMGHPEADGLLNLIEEDASAEDVAQGRIIASEIARTETAHLVQGSDLSAAAFVEADAMQRETAFGYPVDQPSVNWQRDAMDRMESQDANGEALDVGPVPEGVDFVPHPENPDVLDFLREAMIARGINPDEVWYSHMGNRGLSAERSADPFYDNRLTEQENKAVEMARNNFTAREIADEMDISDGNARTLLARARDKGVEVAPGGRDTPLLRELVRLMHLRNGDGGELTNAQMAERLRSMGFRSTAGSVKVSRFRLRAMAKERGVPIDALFSRTAESGYRVNRRNRVRNGIKDRILDEMEAALNRGEIPSQKDIGGRIGTDAVRSHLSSIRNGADRADLADRLSSIEERMFALYEAEHAAQQPVVDALREAADNGISQYEAGIGLGLTKAEAVASAVRRARIARGQSLDVVPDYAAMAERLGLPEDRVRAISASRAKFSRADPRAPFSSVEGLQAYAEETFGADWDAFASAGHIEVVQSPRDVPGHGVPPGTQAVHLRNNRLTYLIADNIKPENLQGVLLHEIGVHQGMAEMLGGRGYREMLRQVETMLKEDHPALIEARAMAERWAARPEHVPEETIAYLVENHADLPLTKRILSTIRQWLIKTFGSTFGMRLTVDDIRGLALTSLRRQAEVARRDAVELSDVPPLNPLLYSKNGEGVLDNTPPPLESQAFRERLADVESSLRDQGFIARGAPSRDAQGNGEGGAAARGGQERARGAEAAGGQRSERRGNRNGAEGLRLQPADIRSILDVSGLRITSGHDLPNGEFQAAIDAPFNIDTPQGKALLGATNVEGEAAAHIRFDIGGPASGRYVRIKWTGVADSVRNMRAGSWLYRTFMDWAFDEGYGVYSDANVSPEAQRMYEALQRRGYKVSRNQQTHTTDDGRLVSNDLISPVFKVERGESTPARDHAAPPPAGWAIDGLTMKERVEQIRERQQEYDKASPAEQAMRDDPGMNFSVKDEGTGHDAGSIRGEHIVLNAHGNSGEAIALRSNLQDRGLRLPGQDRPPDYFTTSESLDDATALPVRLPVREFSLDEISQANPRDLNSRTGNVDRKTVTEYLNRLTSGSEPPPVIVARIDGRLRIIDGRHRLSAQSRAGRTTVRAIDATELFNPSPVAPDGGGAGARPYRATVFHGSPGAIEGEWRPNTFFGATREKAGIYAGDAQGGAGVVHEAQIALRNPYRLISDEPTEIGKVLEIGDPQAVAEIADKLKAQGYDGIVVQTAAEDTPRNIVEVLAFDPQTAIANARTPPAREQAGSGDPAAPNGRATGDEPQYSRRNPDREISARELMDATARAKAEAAEMQKGYEAAAQCAIRNAFQALPTRASFVTLGATARTALPSADAAIGQVIGMTAAIPLGITATPILASAARRASPQNSWLWDTQGQGTRSRFMEAHRLANLAGGGNDSYALHPVTQSVPDSANPGPQPLYQPPPPTQGESPGIHPEGYKVSIAPAPGPSDTKPEQPETTTEDLIRLFRPLTETPQ